MGWDVDLRKQEQKLGRIRSPKLAEVVRAFIFNLRNVDSLLISPALVAADGVSLFYWTLKYLKASTSHALLSSTGEKPTGRSLMSRGARISEANSLMREFLDAPGTTEELAEQIDNRLRQLVQREDFASAMRVQLLSSTVLLWTAYETLRNDLRPIARSYGYSSDNLRPSRGEKGRMANLKEYRNVIVHQAAAVDKRFVDRVGLQQVGEQLKIDGRAASQFFESVCHVGIVMLRALDRRIQRGLTRRVGRPRTVPPKKAGG
jgi:hypothetical protein